MTSAGDLVQVGLKAGGQAAKGAVEAGKGAVWVAGKAWAAPGKVSASKARGRRAGGARGGRETP